MGLYDGEPSPIQDGFVIGNAGFEEDKLKIDVAAEEVFAGDAVIAEMLPVA